MGRTGFICSISLKVFTMALAKIFRQHEKRIVNRECNAGMKNTNHAKVKKKSNEFPSKESVR